MTEMVEILKALSDETRYKLLQLLLTHNYCVGALSYRLNISKPAVSQHLKILKNAGIVNGNKRGYYTHYSVNRDILKNTGINIIELAKTPMIEEQCQKNNSNSDNCCKH